jgi:hypothetical protein
MWVYTRMWVYICGLIHVCGLIYVGLFTPEGCIYVPQKVHVCVQYVLQVGVLELLVAIHRTAMTARSVQKAPVHKAPRSAGAGAHPPPDTPHPLELPRRLLQGLHSL